MVLRHLQPSFTGGEISPALYARTDVSSYYTWLKRAKNWIVHPQGGVSNRSGMQYIAQAKYTDKKCRLFSFLVSEEESYIIEAGEYYLRFFTQGGPVFASAQTPLEIVTPYQEQDLPTLQVAQYNNTWYVAHPKYPLMRLMRTAVGQFTWQQVPLIGGPFMPANTDTAFQLRAYPQTETVQSEGVPAQLAFAPVNYPNLMVYAYFNGEWFYASENFGLDLPAIAQYFNEAYGSSGLAATVQGSIFKITSAATDGGDWNGKTLVLEYRNTFHGTALETVSQVLTGGENAGTQTVVQEGRYILEANQDCFTPLHVGGLFSITHTVDAQYQSGTLGYESVSASIKSGSDWTLLTSGTWTGTLQVEVSRDLGITWKTVKVVNRASGEDNFYFVGNLNDAENLFYVRVRSCQITGEAGYELSAESFIQRGVVEVQNYSSARQVVVSVQRAFGSEEWTSFWAEGSFSPARGYPACVFFFQNRLGLAASQAEAQTLWFSKTGNFMDFGQARDTQLSTDSISVQLGGTQHHAIKSVLVANRLLIFTGNGEWTLACNGALALDTLQLEQQSSWGSSITSPVLVGNRALFVQEQGGAVRELVYDYTTSSYAGQDITLQAKHLFFNKCITQMAFAQTPDHLLWCTTQDGALLTLTYIPEQGICAWTQHETSGQLLSVCTLGNKVWFVVKRENGTFLEILSVRMQEKNPQAQIFLDSSISQQFSQAHTLVQGLTHLEGQTVSALADGNVVTGLVVQNGQITLPFAATIVHVGLPYEAELITLPLQTLIATGRKHRLVAVSVNILDSRGGTIGTGQGTWTQLVQRTDEPYDTPITLQTQIVQVNLSDFHHTTSHVVIKQAEPLPLTILAIGVCVA